MTVRRAGKGNGTTREERRAAARAAGFGQALVSVDRRSGRAYRVENLSASGALLSGGPPLLPGRNVRLVLSLGDEPVGLEARVVRRDDRRTAVSFGRLDAAVEDRIQDEVVAALSGRRLRQLPMDESLPFEPLGEPD